MYHREVRVHLDRIQLHVSRAAPDGESVANRVLQRDAERHVPGGGAQGDAETDACSRHGESVYRSSAQIEAGGRAGPAGVSEQQRFHHPGGQVDGGGNDGGRLKADVAEGQREFGDVGADRARLAALSGDFVQPSLLGGVRYEDPIEFG